MGTERHRIVLISAHSNPRVSATVSGRMPKSKRSRVYSLSSTKKKGHDLKSGLLQEVRDACDTYANVFVYSVESMRNSKIKDLRTEWKHSRFFYGKNRVMQLALGKTEAEEYREGLRHISELLVGSVGLLFTNKAQEEVLEWFANFTDQDFARAGFLAKEDVVLKEGPLDQFPHSMEAQLRTLGLPTTLKKGVVMLVKDHSVCQEGDTLTPEQARALKLLDIKMADFRIILKASWSKGGHFELLHGSESDLATQ